MQPDGNWFRSHVLSWSGDLGIRDVVRDVGTWIGVLAFGIGYVLGAALEPMPRRTRGRCTAGVRPHRGRRAADGERRETVGRRAGEPVAPTTRPVDADADEPVAR